jgi:hypothetical protein
MCQVAAFAEQVAFGALVDLATSQLHSEKKQLEDKVERLRTQNTEATRDKSTAKNKCCNLLERLADDRIEVHSIDLALGGANLSYIEVWGAPKQGIVASHMDMVACPKFDLGYNVEVGMHTDMS